MCSRLFGSYDLLDGGFTKHAFEDFTGGITINFTTVYRDFPRKLFLILLEGFERSCMVSAAIEVRISAMRFCSND